MKLHSKITLTALFFTVQTTAFSVIPLLATNDTAVSIHLCFPDNNSPINNVILSNLSQSLPKRDNKPCLTYQLEIGSEISATNVKTSYKNVKVESIVVFQRFSIRDLLMPIDVTVSLQYFNNKQIVDKKEIKQTMLQNGLLTNYSIPAGKTVNRVAIEIKKVELLPSVLDKIVERQQIINEYYSADIQLKLTEAELKQIDHNHLDSMEHYQYITRKAFAVVEQIRAKNFDKLLYLNEYDPVKLMIRLQAIHSQTFQSKSKLVSQEVNIEKEYYKQGVSALQNSDTILAVSYFNQAIDVAPLYAMPYIQLAGIEIANYNSYGAIKHFEYIDKNLAADSTAVSEASKLLDNLMTTLLEDVKLLRLQGNYNEAKIQLDSCYSLCNSIKFYPCPYQIDIEQIEIYSALYIKYVDLSKTALNNKKYEQLLHYADTAYQLQMQHSQWLNNRPVLFEFLNKAYNELVTYGEQTIKANPAMSLDALMTSKKLCQKYREIPCIGNADNLISSVFVVIYEQMIDEAALLFNAQQIQTADSLQKKAATYCAEQNIEISAKQKELQRLIYQTYYNDIMEDVIESRYASCQALEMVDSAVSLKKRYGLTAANEDTAYTIAAEKCIIYTIGVAERNIILQMYEAAQQNINKIAQMEQKYAIRLNSTDTSRITQINKDLSNEHCINAKFKIDIQLNSAEIFQENHEYVLAIKALENTIALIKQDNNCGFMPKEVEERMAYLKTPAQYQTDRDNAIISIQQHNFETAIKQMLYIQAEYPDSILKQYGLKAEPLLNFIESYNYLPFTLGCIEHLANHGQTETSLELLYNLYAKETEEHLVKKAQDSLGRSLAKRDVAIQKGEDTSMAVYKYIRHDTKWFRTMVKAYKKQWKKSVIS